MISLKQTYSHKHGIKVTLVITEDFSFDENAQRAYNKLATLISLYKKEMQQCNK